MPRPAIARRDEGAYRQYSTPLSEKPSAASAGCSARKMFANSCFGTRMRGAWGREDGLTLAEALIAVVVMTVGLLGSAQLLAITTHTHVLARETTDATRLAQAKVEELMKSAFGTNPSVQVSGMAPDPLEQNVASYFDLPTPSYTSRWRVAAGPTATTRLITIRLVPTQTDLRMARNIEITTLIRQW